MRPLIQEIPTAHTPESLVEQLRGEPDVVLLRSGMFDSPQARRAAYVDFLRARLASPRAFVEEAERARAVHV